MSVRRGVVYFSGEKKLITFLEDILYIRPVKKKTLRTEILLNIARYFLLRKESIGVYRRCCLLAIGLISRLDKNAPFDCTFSRIKVRKRNLNDWVSPHLLTEVIWCVSQG